MLIPSSKLAPSSSQLAFCRTLAINPICGCTNCGRLQDAIALGCSSAVVFVCVACRPNTTLPPYASCSSGRPLKDISQKRAVPRVAIMAIGVKPSLLQHQSLATESGMS